jgi:hypothetical protein
MVRLRIEDIDSPRIKPGATEQALDDLRWLGLDWDGEPIVQTARLPHYESALESLKQRELVYPCTCSRTDIANAASAPHAEHEGPVYPGTCSHRQASDASALHAQGRPFAWRFRVGDSPTFTDLFAGKQQIDLQQLGGDFVIWKNAGTPAYQVAVVVDDAAMGITEVCFPQPRGSWCSIRHWVWPRPHSLTFPWWSVRMAAAWPNGTATRGLPLYAMLEFSQKLWWDYWRGRAGGSRSRSRSRQRSCCRFSGSRQSRSIRSF